jgi:predicted O-methyltransferase YrrM
MVRHLSNCLSRWAQLATVTQNGGPAERSPSIRGEEADLAAFIGGMHNLSAPFADEVVGRLKPFEFSHLLDIGGASGTWTMAFLKAAPEAKATLFDLPPVISMAEKRLGEAGFAEKVTLVAGDYNVHELPKGADLAWLSAICHQNSREQNRELFAKTHRALTDDGQLVIRDVVLDPSRTRPVRGALFAVNMLIATDGGDSYTLEEYTEDLHKAGFDEVTLVNQDEFMNSLIRARKA